MTKTSVLTPEHRLSFFDLFEAKPDMNGKLGFRAELLFPKTIKMSELRELQELHDETVPKEWKTGGLPYRSFKECFLNGDGKKQEGRKGHWMLRAQSGPEYPPRLITETKAIALKGDLYAGAFARSIVSAYPWTHSNDKGVVIKRGVSFNLLTVQRTRKPLADGSDRFGAFVSLEEQDELLNAAPLSAADADELLA